MENLSIDLMESNKENIFDFKKISYPFFESRPGRNMITILPFRLKTDNIRNRKKGDMVMYLKLDVHKGISENKSFFLCTELFNGNKCAICDEIRRLRETKKYDEKELKKISAKEQSNMIVLDHYDNKIKIFSVSSYLFTDKLKNLMILKNSDGKGFPVLHYAPNGYSIEFMDTGVPLTKYDSFSLVPIQNYKEDFLMNIQSLDEALIIPEYERARTLVSRQIFYSNNSQDQKNQNNNEGNPPF